MRDTIDMMREACDKDKVDAWQNDFWTITQEELERLVSIVRADEREQARSAPVQEPVAWMYWQSCLNDDGTQTAPWVQRYSKFKPPESVINKEITPLYTTSPAAQRQWVGLTEDEIKLFISGHGDEDDDDYVEPTGEGFGVTDSDLVKLVRRAEAKLKEKNCD